MTETAQNAIELLTQLIAIPSFSSEEKTAADVFQSYVESRGYVCHRKGNNLWLTSAHNVEGKPVMMLNSHIDTVKPVKAWTHNPFAPEVIDGKLYGLGSNDAGASLVSLLHVFFELAKKPQSYNLILAVSAEEETTGSNGMELLMNELPKIDVAVVGEPTRMQMAVAEKGLMVLDCKTLGKAGHAARNEGENALYKALQDIEWFRNHRFERVSDFLGEVKMTVTVIKAGSQHNVVPDRCKFVVDVRSNELYSNTELLEEIKRHVSCVVKPRPFLLKSSFIDLRHPLVHRGKAMGMQMFGSPTTSDQSFVSCPSIKLGPGDSARSHTADEFVYLHEIENGIRTYLELLDGLIIPKHEDNRMRHQRRKEYI
jgi:acetylornithine deacetylase